MESNNQNIISEDGEKKIKRFISFALIGVIPLLQKGNFFKENTKQNTKDELLFKLLDEAYRSFSFDKQVPYYEESLKTLKGSITQ